MSPRLSILSLCSLLLCGCVPIPQSEVAYRDSKATVKDRDVLYFPWPTIVAERSVINVCGHSYSHVRGAGPCYLEIPGKNTILFVTGGEGSAVVHLVDMDTRKERHFRAYDSNIGKCIRPSTEAGKREYERVESAAGDTIVISALALNKSRYKYFIDLKQPKLIREERDFLGYDGKWHHCIFEGGKAHWDDAGQSGDSATLEDNDK